MTEQNTAYRTDSDPISEDDPLAELARIVSGENPAYETRKPVPAAVAVSKDGATQSNTLSLAGDFDIEQALMQELGGPEAGSSAIRHAETSVISRETARTQNSLGAETAVSSLPHQPAPFSSRATPVAPPAEISLEDQLMAELSASGDGFDNQPEQIVDTGTDYADVFETDPMVEEAIHNAMRDVEAADVDLSASLADEPVEQHDPFADFDRAAQAMRDEPGLATSFHVSGDDDDLEDFFSEGFEDILAESAPAPQAALEEVGTELPEDAFQPHGSEAAVGGLDEFGLEDEFSAAFERELAGATQTRETGVNEPGQEEFALENEFAKSFANELGVGRYESRFDELAPATAASAGAGYSAPPRAVETYSEFDHPQGGAFSAPQMAEPQFAESPTSGKGFKMAVGALGVALLLGMGVVGWGYYSGSGNSGPALIKADAEPSKVKPDDPGGQQIANQDNEVYNRVAGTPAQEPQQEELITSREQPVDVEPKSDSRLAPNSNTDAPRDATAQAAPLGLSPKRVRTLTVKPDGTIIPATQTAAFTDPTPSAASESGAADENAASVLQQPATEADAEPIGVAQVDGSSVGIDGAVSTGALAVPQPSPLPAPQSAPLAPVAVAPAAPAPTVPAATAPVPDPNAPTQIASLNNDQAPAPAAAVTSSDWKIQVSSQRSREAAEASFTNLQRRFSSVLGGRSAVIERAEVQDKGTFYRAKVLAESRDEATSLCSRLKSAGGSCFVTR